MLADNGLYDGSRYLVGYVIELALEARICRVLDLAEYPDRGNLSGAFKTHKLNDLILLAGLQRKLADQTAASVAFLTNWYLVTNWSEEYRSDRKSVV